MLKFYEPSIPSMVNRTVVSDILPHLLPSIVTKKKMWWPVWILEATWAISGYVALVQVLGESTRLMVLRGA